MTYSRDQACAAGVVEQSDGSVVDLLGDRLSCASVCRRIMVVLILLVLVVIIFLDPLGADEVPVLLDLLYQLRDGLLEPRVILGGQLTVRSDVSVAGPASSRSQIYGPGGAT